MPALAVMDRRVALTGVRDGDVGEEYLIMREDEILAVIETG